LIPASGRTPGGEHGNPLQYSCLENAMDRGAWQATYHRITKRQTQLRTHAGYAMFLKFLQSCLTLFDPLTVAHQAPLSMRFPRQEYWSGCHFLFQWIFLTWRSNHIRYISCTGRWVFTTSTTWEAIYVLLVKIFLWFLHEI